MSARFSLNNVAWHIEPAEEELQVGHPPNFSRSFWLSFFEPFSGSESESPCDGACNAGIRPIVWLLWLSCTADRKSVIFDTN